MGTPLCMNETVYIKAGGGLKPVAVFLSLGISSHTYSMVGFVRLRTKNQMSQMGLKAAAPRLQRIVSNVEVERKFNPGPKFASLFLSSGRTKLQAQPHKFCSNNDGSSFTVLRQPMELIRDTYYDTHDSHLCKLGLWVRQRHVHVLPFNPPTLERNQNGEVVTERVFPLSTEGSEKEQWNAKLRLGGNFSNTQFVEFDGREKVSDEVLRITGTRTKLEDLRVVSDLRTRRLSWEVTQLADGTAPSVKMTIVLDEVTEAESDAGDDGSSESAFIHTIGEVELFDKFVTENKDSTGHEAYRKEVAAQRMDELKKFMLLNPDLFTTTPKPIGKLTAYDTWRTSRS
ncbi:hypothetical protein F5B21DRAFT_99484 [Xylaria acuta]|nr:hypothetical protein F5B21DRAFT_99484 [Xylaria acuta]